MVIFKSLLINLKILYSFNVAFVESNFLVVVSVDVEDAIATFKISRNSTSTQKSKSTNVNQKRSSESISINASKRRKISSACEKAKSSVSNQKDALVQVVHENGYEGENRNLFQLIQLVC